MGNQLRQIQNARLQYGCAALEGGSFGDALAQMALAAENVFPEHPLHAVQVYSSG